MSLIDEIKIKSLSEAQEILKAAGTEEILDFEKAHKDGDLHPNGKWVWVSSANGGKGDWRTLNGRTHKKHQAANAAGGGSSSASSTTGGNSSSVKTTSSKSKTSASSIATVDDAATFLQKNVDKWREYQYEELDDEKLEKQFDEANKYIKDFKEFDWKEEDEADDYKEKMEKRGYKIVDLGEGSDTYIFAVLKKSKKK